MRLRSRSLRLLWLGSRLILRLLLRLRFRLRRRPGWSLWLWSLGLWRWRLFLEERRALLLHSNRRLELPLRLLESLQLYRILLLLKTRSLLELRSFLELLLLRTVLLSLELSRLETLLLETLLFLKVRLSLELLLERIPLRYKVSLRLEVALTCKQPTGLLSVLWRSGLPSEILSTLSHRCAKLRTGYVAQPTSRSWSTLRLPRSR